MRMLELQDIRAQNEESIVHLYIIDSVHESERLFAITRLVKLLTYNEVPDCIIGETFFQRGLSLLFFLKYIA